MSDWLINAIWSLTPTVVAGLVFWLILRSIVRADRTERREYSRIEAEERAKVGLPPKQS
jgi:flagellar biosynthesis/type III secretory pathway M-ring protein FliF/YscJ